MEYTPQELALAIRKIIESHPENWEQQVWFGYESIGDTVDTIRRDLEEDTCGTKACVAGWTAILVSPKGTRLVSNHFIGTYDSLLYPSGSMELIRQVAAKALGLTPAQADWLFDSPRTREEVVAALTVIETGFGWQDDWQYCGRMTGSTSET